MAMRKWHHTRVVVYALDYFPWIKLSNRIDHHSLHNCHSTIGSKSEPVKQNQFHWNTWMQLNYNYFWKLNLYFHHFRYPICWSEFGSTPAPRFYCNFWRFPRPNRIKPPRTEFRMQDTEFSSAASPLSGWQTQDNFLILHFPNHCIS